MYQAIRPEAIPRRGRKINPMVKDDLQDFMSTSALAAEIRIPEGRTPKCVYTSYYKAAKELGYQLQFMLRGNRLFMRKKTALGAGTPKGGK